MNSVLLQIRAKAFFAEAGTLFLVAIVAALSSPQFSEIVTTHFGESLMGSAILLVANGLVKHFVNVRTMKTQADKVGANRESDPFVLI
jgi:hypothetical protein